MTKFDRVEEESGWLDQGMEHINAASSGRYFLSKNVILKACMKTSTSLKKLTKLVDIIPLIFDIQTPAVADLQR